MLCRGIRVFIVVLSIKNKNADRHTVGADRLDNVSPEVDMSGRHQAFYCLGSGIHCNYLS